MTPGMIAAAGLGLALVIAAFALRGLLQDAVAGLWLRREGQLPAIGDRIAVELHEGVVTSVLLRGVVLRTPDGGERTVRHHTLLRESVTRRPRYPRVEVDVVVPWQGTSELVRERLEEAALLSPWTAPGCRPELERHGEPGGWRIAIQILDERFARQHREVVRDLVAHGLGAPEDYGSDG